jgi:mRNA interferase RelE/StbE
MGSFRVEWKPSTKRDLRRIAPDQVARIVQVVAGLAAEPRPVGCQKLQGTEHTYRNRAGDYRAVYTVSDQLLTVTVVRVRHRREVYRK